MAIASTYIGGAEDDTNSTTYNFGNFTAAGAGIMVVGFLAQGATAQTVASVSIGGTNGGLHITNLSGTTKWAFASRAVAAGAQNVTVTLSGANGAGETHVGVWLITGGAVLFHAPAAVTGSAASKVQTINTGPSGIALLASFHLNTSPGTWNNATSDESTQMGATSAWANFAHLATSLETPHSETVSWTGAVASVVMGLSFIPNNISSVASTYIGGVEDDTNSTTYNYGNFNAATDGLMVVGFLAQGVSARTVSSVSIGGTNGTNHITNASSSTKWAFASRAVSAGNNNVTVTLSGANGVGETHVGVWLVTGYSSVTPFATPAAVIGSAANKVQTINTDTYGLALFASFHLNTSPGAWSTAISDESTQMGATSAWANFGHLFTSSETPHSETVTWVGAVGSQIMGLSFQGAVAVNDDLNQASLVLTSYDMGDTLGFADALDQASIVLTSYAVDEALAVADALDQASLILTSNALTEALTLNEALNAAGIVLTGFPLGQTIRGKLHPSVNQAPHKPGLILTRIITPSLRRLRSVASRLRRTRGSPPTLRDT